MAKNKSRKCKECKGLGFVSINLPKFLMFGKASSHHTFTCSGCGGKGVKQ